jgi:hypothetical protein
MDTDDVAVVFLEERKAIAIRCSVVTDVQCDTEVGGERQSFDKTLFRC